MESVEQYHIVFGGLILSFVIYWGIHQGLQHALRIFAPVSYRKLNQNRVTGLLVFMSMVMRAVIGALVTVPSCIVAAQQTPWDYGHGMNLAGGVCVISQAVPFVAELQLLLDTNVEVFQHHVACLVLIANILAFPQMHMIKPFYLFFASQFGDVSVTVYKCAKLLGWKPQTSWTVYLAKIWTTVLLLFSKSGVVFYVAAKVFKSPYRLIDWLWEICMLFFAVYSLEGTGFNLLYLGIAQKLPKSGPAGMLFPCGLRVTRFSMITVASMTFAVIMRTMAYGFLLDREMATEEHGSARREAILSAGVAFVVVKSSTAFLERQLGNHLLVKGEHGPTKKRELYSRIGTLLFATWISAEIMFASSERRMGLDLAALAGSTAFVLPLWDTGMRIGIYSSVGEGSGHVEDDATETAPKANGIKPTEGITEQAPGAKRHVTSRDFQNARYQLRMIWANFFILILGFILPLQVTSAETNLTMLAAHAVVQLLAETTMQPQSMGKNLAVSNRAQSPMPVTSYLAFMELCLTFAALYGFSHPPQGNRLRSIKILSAALGMGILANVSSRLIPMVKKKKIIGPKTSAKKGSSLRFLSKVVKKVSHPIVYTLPILFVLQIIELRFIWQGHNYTGPVETGFGFQNVIKVMESPLAIGGGLAGLQLVTFALWWCT